MSRVDFQLEKGLTHRDGYDSYATEIVNQVTPNRAPVTAGARAVVSHPPAPDHEWAEVSIAGVSDPDGDPVSLEVVGITQDEPAGSAPGGWRQGEGPHCPDGAIVGGKARVRWERR